MCALALIFSTSVCWDVAAGSAHEYPKLPLGMDEFQSFVDGLAAEVNGSKGAMAERLQSLGFTCTAADAIQFSCVRFGCRKRRGFLWQGALLQWSVTDLSSFSGKEFDAAAINYSYAAGCISEKDIAEAQKNFLSGMHRGQ